MTGREGQFLGRARRCLIAGAHMDDPRAGGKRFRRRAATGAILLVVVCCGAADVRLGNGKAGGEASLPVVIQGNGLAASGVLGGEKPVLKLLAAGHQSEAEALLLAQVRQFPRALELVQLVKAERLKEADHFLDANRPELLAAQRTLFLFAACCRSRFDTAGTTPIFHTAYGIDKSTPSAKCAWLVKRLDSDKMKWASQQIVDDAFADLKKLADENPHDIFIRWMLAVQCRTWDRNAEGVEQYRQILEQWDPGPALVHQTYANLFDELGRFDEALVERHKAVKMEPASWTFDGLGNTLKGLRRFQEANEAYVTALSMEPVCLRYWIHWANGWLGRGNIPIQLGFVNVFVFVACAGVGGRLLVRKLLGSN